MVYFISCMFRNQNSVIFNLITRFDLVKGEHVLEDVKGIKMLVVSAFEYLLLHK